MKNPASEKKDRSPFLSCSFRRLFSLPAIRILAAVILSSAILCTFPGQAYAEAMWNEDYWRAVDTADRLSEAEVDNLDAGCLAFMETWHADLAMIALTSESYAGEDITVYAEGYYEECGFGYGPDHSGFQVIWDTDTDELAVIPFGAAESMVPEDYLQFISKTAPPYREQYGIYGPLYASLRLLDNYLKEHGGTAGDAAADGSSTGAASDGSSTGAASDGSSDAFTGSSSAENTAGTGSEENRSAEGISSETEPAGTPGGGGNRDGEIPLREIPDSSLRVGEGASMPAWYPKDPSTFPFYLDETAPRVVDTADIFTSEEEAAMTARLAEIRNELEKDIVVFTDLSTYGLSRAVYAADFYDFNGYGCGNDREGAVLFICMDPSARGGWTCCTGPVTRGLYTEEIANQIDDMLYEYLGAGRYGEGVSDWIENFRRLYLSGSPYTPDWAMQDLSSITRFHDAEAPRIVDDAHLLTDEEISSLTAQAADLSAKYGLDVVIHTARDPGSMDSQEYSDAFYACNGYGFGEEYDGILLTIFKRPGHTPPHPGMTASGKGMEKLTDTNRKRLTGRCASEVEADHYYEAASAWLDQTGHMLRTGRAPRSTLSWYLFTLLELAAGAICGGISLLRAKARMATPKVHTDARQYLVRDSVNIRNVSDDFLDSRTTKVYSPLKDDDDSPSGSSGGSSSYSSSYSGSSGSTHSGSGRSF